jgi:alanyl-tRNA synthetase
MEEHRLASGGGKAIGRLGGEDAEFFAGILKDLQRQKKLGEHGVEYDPYTGWRVQGEVLALIVDGRSVESASFGDRVEVILPRTGFYIESGGQVDDTGYIRSSSSLAAGQPHWEIEITSMRRASAGVIVHVGEVISGQPKVGDLAIAEVDMQRRHDIMRNHTATHLLHAALHQVLGEHARQAGSLVAPDRLRFDFNHPEAMTSEQIERVERIVNEAVAADMEVMPKLKSREDAIAEGAMALFGEKYGETVRTITIAPPSAAARLEETETVAHPAAVMEKLPKYSYELCGGTHLERTSDVGAFLIVSEGSAAAGVRRIEAVTGRGAYDVIAHRFKLLKQTAAALKSSLEEVPFKVESLQDEVADLKKELASLRASQALSSFNQQLSNVRMVRDIHVMALEVPNSNADTLRTLADRFREKYPRNGIALLTSNGMVIAVVTEDLVRRGLKAGDLISSVGGRGGGRPNLAQGSLPDPALMNDAMDKMAKTVEEKLK